MGINKISEEEVKKLQEYIGAGVVVIYRNFGSTEENKIVAHLKEVNADYMILINEEEKKFCIDFSAFKRCRIFVEYGENGIYKEIYDGYQKDELISSIFDNDKSLKEIPFPKKYDYIIEGLPLVKKRFQKRWIVLVEYFRTVFIDYFGVDLVEEDKNKLLDLIISILKQMQKRISYGLIYQNLKENNNVSKEEILAVLEIVSNFTDGGKFLKEYIIDRMNKEELILSLQK